VAPGGIDVSDGRLVDLGETENEPAALCADVVGAVRAVRPDFSPDVGEALATPAPH
jgi:hypothetical protein